MADTHHSFTRFPYAGLALDPIHVGAGGSRLGRVDMTIVRDPATRVPKIPGSSLAGVLRAYAAMAEKKYPECAGQGQPRPDGTGGHCGEPECPICTVFGFARGNAGGFAGLAAFSDAHVLLFPVATREGPVWVTCPNALRMLGDSQGEAEALRLDNEAIYRANEGSPLNLGWLMLPVKKFNGCKAITDELSKLGVNNEIVQKLAIVSDKLFGHVVNSNLEIRTSVSIDPETGAAEEGALFTYEALPRGTVLAWDVTCRHPKHFRIKQAEVTAVSNPKAVRDVVARAFTYLEHLGIGGMGTRGMGRLRVVNQQEAS
jgi:CRISPR-associated protein Cmr4